MRVSVVVPVYNAAHVLGRTLPAVLDLDYPRGRLELLFVDDGSTDGSARLLDRMAGSHGCARVLRHGENRGRAAARNTGLAAATGHLLLFLDADVEPEPDLVRQHVLAHEEPGVVGAISNPVLDGLEEGDPYHDYLRWREQTRRFEPGQPLPFKYYIIGYTSVQAAAVREVGGFDERLSYGEDLDFAYRLWQRHPRGLRFAPRAVVRHHDHGRLEDRVAKLRAFGREGLPLLVAKHPGLARAGGLGFVPSPGDAIGLRSLLGRALLRGPGAAAARAALAHSPRPLAHRLVRYVLATAVAEGYRAAPS